MPQGAPLSAISRHLPPSLTFSHLRSPLNAARTSPTSSPTFYASTRPLLRGVPRRATPQPPRGTPQLPRGSRTGRTCCSRSWEDAPRRRSEPTTHALPHLRLSSSSLRNSSSSRTAAKTCRHEKVKMNHLTVSLINDQTQNTQNTNTNTAANFAVQRPEKVK